MNFLCGPGTGWGGWNMGGWHFGGWMFPGFFILLLFGFVLWLLLRRPATPAVATLHCPKCSGSIQPVFFRCPHCGEALKHHCSNCSRIVEHDWAYCPFCNQAQTTAEQTQPEQS